MSILPQLTGQCRIAANIRDWLLPNSCLLCGADAGPAIVCTPCRSELPAPPTPSCPHCGEPTSHGERCGQCLMQAPAYSGVTAAFRYAFPVDRMIHALKYQHQLALADWFADVLAEKLTGQAVDLIVPLPLHVSRLRERGFNQATEIARRLGKMLKTDVDRNTLWRTRETQPQAGLPLSSRAANVRGAFACRRSLEGQRILLVDDVMTTGATLGEAAHTLRRHGAAEVRLAVVARALRR